MTLDPSETWLARWHDRRAGATSRVFLHAKPCSYEWLAERARPGDRVLDLACGDGALLSALGARGVSGAVGIDMSEGELAAARERLGPSARLVLGRAQELPFKDESFDLVTCHMALMLMVPVDEVIAEIGRVLAPGGTFAAVLGSRAPASAQDAWAMIGRRARGEPWRGPAIGDKRTSTEEGLRSLFSDFASVEVEARQVWADKTPDEVIALFHESYTPELLAPECVEAIEALARMDWQAILRPDGTVACSFALLVLTARKALAPR